MKSILNSRHRADILRRFDHLDPAQPALWGQLTAPRMLVHLCDQMHMQMGEQELDPIPSPANYPVLRELILYLLPWLKGKIKGPPEAFVTNPTQWADDLTALNELVDQFVSHGPRDRWPNHPHFGRMSRRDWGVFCYRHFNHHLRQFGV